MSTLLIDIDANSRQPGFNYTKMGSKIPSPLKIQHTSSTGLRPPFAVSMTGSPSYIAVPEDTKAVASPTPASKLPRKLMPTQSAFSKSYKCGNKPGTPHASSPQYRNWRKPTPVVVPSSSVSWPIGHKTIIADLRQNPIRTTPPPSYNKPLPSPPVAQILNPASPPKAKRTLVDAEAGSPTEEVWPVLQPDNLLLSKSPAPVKTSMLPQRSISEGSALRWSGVPVLGDRGILYFANNSIPLQKSDFLDEAEQLGDSRPKILTGPRALGPLNPYSKSFHALSTDSNIAMGSPHVPKQQTIAAIAIPPRISSKRVPLLSPDTSAGESHKQFSASLRPENAGCNKLPNSAAGEETGVLVDSIVNDEHLLAEPENSQQFSFDGADVAQPHYGSIDSVSTWSLAAGSSLADEAGVNDEGSARVKHLSWHSSDPRTGPTLRIAVDADEILLGQDREIPTVPTVSEYMVPESLHQHSGVTLPGRVSRQVLVNTDAAAVSRTPTPSWAETQIIGNRPVKITPIRSMQPPRKPSTEDLSQRSLSLSTPALAEVPKCQGILCASHSHFHGSVEAPQDLVSLHVNEALNDFTVDLPVTTLESRTAPTSSREPQNGANEAGNCSTILQDDVPQEAGQVIGSKADSPRPAIRNRLLMAWMTPKSATFTPKNSAAARKKTSPLLRSTQRVDNRASAVSTRSPSSTSSGLTRSDLPQDGTHHLGLSRTGISETVAQHVGLIHDDISNGGPPTSEQAAVDKTFRSRAKRSFNPVSSRRNSKTTPEPVKDQISRRSSMTSNAVVQRIRNSANFFKVSLTRPSAAKVKIKGDDLICADSVVLPSKGQERQATLAALKSTAETAPSHASNLPVHSSQCETATVIHNILDSVTSMKKGSPDCLRGLEIAEAVLYAVDCSKQANLSAELARKSARDAELSAERAGIELQRLEELCKQSFAEDTMKAIRQLIAAACIAPP